MSYEIYVMDPAFAPTLEAAYSAWDNGMDWDSLVPDHDRSAPKWQISDGLLAFNPKMLRMEPTSPDGGGWLDKALGAEENARNHLVMSLVHGDAITSFSVFDQVVEVVFPYNVSAEQVPEIARDAWRHLQALVDMGLTTVLDTERKALLDLNRDFETVLAAYRVMLKIEADVDGADAKAGREMRAAANSAATAAPPRANAPFTGNIEPIKPWWKIW